MQLRWGPIYREPRAPPDKFDILVVCVRRLCGALWNTLGAPGGPSGPHTHVGFVRRPCGAILESSRRPVRLRPAVLLRLRRLTFTVCASQVQHTVDLIHGCTLVYTLMPGAQRARRASTVRPAAAQGASKTDSVRPRGPREAPKTAPEGPGTPKDGPKTPKICSRRPKRPPKCPKRPPKRLPKRAPRGQHH